MCDEEQKREYEDWVFISVRGRIRNFQNSALCEKKRDCGCIITIYRSSSFSSSTARREACAPCEAKNCGMAAHCDLPLMKRVLLLVEKAVALRLQKTQWFPI